jgi:hypothetical protein
MKFQEAREKLKEMVGDKYRYIGFRLTEWNENNVDQTDCELYVADYGLFSAPTWEKVFEKLENAMSRKNPEGVKEEIPET